MGGGEHGDRRPPLFDDVKLEPAPVADIRGARVLAIYGDLVTTEHVSPMGMIPPDSASGLYLRSLGVAPADFVSFAARRLNHDVMIRGTLASAHLKNEMTPGRPGGCTLHMPGREPMSIYDAAQRYRQDAVPLVIVAGSGYGTGSSRDWSAKGVRLARRARSHRGIIRAHSSRQPGRGRRAAVAVRAGPHAPHVVHGRQRSARYHGSRRCA
jgi:aconitate hydratase